MSNRYHRRHGQKAPSSPAGGNAPKGHVGGAASPSSGPATTALTPLAQTEPSRWVALSPLAPVVVRSGRPFDGQAGVDPARLPPPSTVAGCLRTAWARANGKRLSRELLHHPVAGPLLRRVDPEGGACELLLPKPTDALYFGHGTEARCYRAEPKPYPPGCGSDLPEGLLPVQLSEMVEGKPGSGPAWWSFHHWLAFRTGSSSPTVAELEREGWSPPLGDRRTHVAINARGAAEEGKLFQTEGLDFASGFAHENGWLRGVTAEVELLARFAEPLGSGVVTLGGERRLAALRPQAETSWPKPPNGWLEQIRQAGGLTLTLVTPGLFSAGYRPGWMGESPPEITGLRLGLVAAAVERWQPHSGWDLEQRQPRPHRRLVPAGAVYWCRLLGEPTPEALAALWLASLCDDEQDRRDGFGLALPAPWQPPTTL